MYNFSSKIVYALAGLCDIVIYGKKKPVPLSDIIRREKVPKVYMERILSNLVKSGILKSKKGAFGGFTLKKRLKDISVFNLYEIFQSNGHQKDNTVNLKNKNIKSLISQTELKIGLRMADMLKSYKLDAFINSIEKNKKRPVKKA